jgi:predicted dehydrogenase
MSDAPLRIALLGIGNRALPKKPEGSNFAGWVEQIARCPLTQLVAAQDPSDQARARMVERGYLGPEQVFADAGAMLSQTKADAVLVCSPGEYHAAGARQAVDAGYHVMLEKPFVTNMAEGRELLARIEAAGVVSTVVQNWRYKDMGRRLKAFIASGELGRVGQVFFRYVRNRENPNYPAYLFQEQYPLLYAMGSHHLDLFRYALADEIVEVTGQASRPAWSMYASVTTHNLTMRTAGGVFITYAATFSSMNNALPQESLVVEGEKGTLVNNSEWGEPPLLFYPKGGKEPVDLTAEILDSSTRGQYDAADSFILNDFAQAALTGRASDCPASDSFRSMELLEACRKACETGERVVLATQAGQQGGAQ